MSRNHEVVGRSGGANARRGERGAVGGRSGPAVRRPLRRGGLLAVVAGLTAVALAACGPDAKEGVRTRGDVSSRRGGGVTPASPSGSGTVLVSDTRPGGASGVGPVESPGKPSAPANVSYSDAEGVFRAGDYALAADLFEAYTLRRPENPWGHYMLGISAWRDGDHARAEAALKRTIEVDPEHAKALLNLARVLLEQRKASDALDYVERVVELKPESGEGRRVLGNARSDLGMADAALAAYREALVLNHRDAWTMNNLGLLMIREGRYEEALPPLARATELHPDVAVFQNNLGLALERSGHLAEAADAFRAALIARPVYEKARVSLVRVESQAPTATVETLDLAALASGFADEVSRWKEQSLAAELVETLELVVPLEATDSTEAVEPAGTVDSTKAAGSTGHGG